MRLPRSYPGPGGRGLRAAIDWLSIILLAVPTLMATGCAGEDPDTPGVGDQAAVSKSTPHAPGFPDWLREASLYHIFLLSFSDANGDGAGDLAGLVQQLDYLNDGAPGGLDLGVDALLLSPIHSATGGGGRAITDHHHPAPIYGSMDEARALVEAAHARGLRVILDMPINQVSVRHPWFLEAVRDTASSRRDWFLWSDEDPGWLRPWEPFDDARTWYPSGEGDEGPYYYALFEPGAPDLNLAHPDVVTEIERALSTWVDLGVDGIRIRDARFLVEDLALGEGPGQQDTEGTIRLLRRLRDHVCERKPDLAFLIEVRGSVPGSSPYHQAGGAGTLLTFDMDLQRVLQRGLRQRNGAEIAGQLGRLQARVESGGAMGLMLGDPHLTRLARELRDDTAGLRLGAALLLTLPGVPSIYYGNEIGVTNGDFLADAITRTPLPWTAVPPGFGFTTAPRPAIPFAPGAGSVNVAAQLNEPRSLLSLHRDLLRARAASEALRRGSAELLTPEAGLAPMIAFVRRTPDDAALVAVNVSDRPASLRGVVSGARALPALLSDEGVPDPMRESDGWRIVMPPRTAAIWRLEEAAGD